MSSDHPQHPSDSSFSLRRRTPHQTSIDHQSTNSPLPTPAHSPTSSKPHHQEPEPTSHDPSSDENLQSNSDHTPHPIDPSSSSTPEDDPLCRICLGGRDDEDSSLGRFIQPCLCRGTMAFIHVGCLQRWRLTAPSVRSFYQCDQCGYRYKLRRAKAAGLAENKMILGCVTASDAS